MTDPTMKMQQTRTLVRAMRSGKYPAALIALSLALLPIACEPTGPTTTGFTVSARVANDVDTSNIMRWVEKLAAVRANDSRVNNEGFTPQDMFPSDQLTRDAATQLVTSAFSAMGYTPHTVVLGSAPLAAYNVEAEWPGTSRRSEVVLVACHHDAFFAGADDNGSAVAAMLEAARAVRLHHFARTVRFVSFDLEEFGSIGSTRYVQAGLANDVTQAIVLETIGFASNEPGSQKDLSVLRLPDKGDFLFVIGNKESAGMSQQMVAMGNSLGIAKLFGLIAAGDGTNFLSSSLMRSDHGLLWFRGIPTLFLTDGANYRNPNYHKASDLPQTLDRIFLARNTLALTAAVALFAKVQP